MGLHARGAFALVLSARPVGPGAMLSRTHVEDDMAARRTDANFSQGWGIAALVTALAVTAFLTAFAINRKTFHPPTDPMSPNQAREEAHGPTS